MATESVAPARNPYERTLTTQQKLMRAVAMIELVAKMRESEDDAPATETLEAAAELIYSVLGDVERASR
jgi:hypothetical protein